MARYRKISVSMWGDAKFGRLSKPQPCGQALWFYLLTGPYTTNIPGVIRAKPMVLAAELEWFPEAFREAFQEVCSEGMAKADEKGGVIWLPRAIHHNRPESPNVVRSWRLHWEELPECALKVEIWQALKAFCEALGKAFAEAFAEACAHPSPNQEQEQEQEQEQTYSERVNPSLVAPAHAREADAPPDNGCDALRASESGESTLLAVTEQGEQKRAVEATTGARAKNAMEWFNQWDAWAKERAIPQWRSDSVNMPQLIGRALRRLRADPSAGGNGLTDLEIEHALRVLLHRGQEKQHRRKSDSYADYRNCWQWPDNIVFAANQVLPEPPMTPAEIDALGKRLAAERKKAKHAR